MDIEGGVAEEKKDEQEESSDKEEEEEIPIIEGMDTVNATVERKESDTNPDQPDHLKHDKNHAIAKRKKSSSNSTNMAKNQS
eukprot:13481731-Ditylum_brightwellii.AAC.1